MEVSNLTAALKHDAVGVVFVNVLLQQLGLPVRAVATNRRCSSTCVVLLARRWKGLLQLPHEPLWKP